jgi:hypothetical protein
MIAPSVLPGGTYQPIDRVSRLLFSWRADELSLKALTGEPGTFARAGASGTAVDGAGRLYQHPHSQPVFEMTDEDGDGVYERPWLRVEYFTSNVCLWSEDFSQWTPTGTPTRVAAALRLGSVVLDLIGDNDGAAAEFYARTVALNGNTVKAVSLTMAKGLTPNSTGSVIRFRQTTGTPADRLLATVTWNADGSPSVAMTTGTYLGSVKLALGAYRLLFQTTSATAAETHQLEVRPTTLTASETGDVFAGAVQVEDAAFPSSYAPTGAGAGVKQPDAVSWGITLGVQALTLYGEWDPAFPLTAIPAAVLGVAALGNGFAGATDEALLVRSLAGTTLRAEHGSNANTVASDIADFSGLTTPLRWAAQLSADGAVQLHVRGKNGVTKSGAKSAAREFVGAVWTGNTLWLGRAQAGVDIGVARHRTLKVAAGVVDLTALDGML